MITLLCFTYFLCINVTFNDNQGFNSLVIVAILVLMHMHHAHAHLPDTQYYKSAQQSSHTLNDRLNCTTGEKNTCDNHISNETGRCIQMRGSI
jgi:hypothetical protein